MGKAILGHFMISLILISKSKSWLIEVGSQLIVNSDNACYLYHGTLYKAFIIQKSLDFQQKETKVVSRADDFLVT